MSTKAPKGNRSTLTKEQLLSLTKLAIAAAVEAGELIEQCDHQKLQHRIKGSGSSAASQIVTEIDIASEELIRKRLSEISEHLDSEHLDSQHLDSQHLDSPPLEFAFVGEESCFSAPSEAQDRFDKPFFWCVDPLDGTLPFSEGRSGYAVSIALLDQSGEPLIGVVYDPARQAVSHAIAGQGACLNSSQSDSSCIHLPNGGSSSLVVYADGSFKTHQDCQLAMIALEQCAALQGLSSVSFVYGNGAVKNACHVLDSSNACYLKLPKKQEGGGSIWDFAATSCIAKEAGAWASDIYGQPLVFNRRDSTFMNHQGILFASNSQIAQCLIDELKKVLR